MKIKNLFLSALILTAFAFAVSSCGHKNEAPVINLEEPDATSNLVLGDSIHIEGTVTDDESLHEMSITITNPSGGTVFQSFPTVHNLKTYDFHYHFTPLAAEVLTLTIIAEDHEGESATKTATITVSP